MNVKRKALRAAFPHTIPIMAGFLFLGIAYGIFMQSKGFFFIWPMLMSMTIFAGSMEFVTVSLLASAFNPLYAYLLTLMVNARHLFYGISRLDTFRGTGRKKPYLIFGMCDESFSILCSTKAPEGVDHGWFCFFVTLLNQCYWVAGATIGGLIGGFLPFELEGIDFVMTALFVVIFLEQWLSQKHHLPAWVGLGASALCLVFFRSDQFILPAMACILILLTVLRKPISRKLEGGETA